jgi:oligoendopeptidase F
MVCARIRGVPVAEQPSLDARWDLTPIFATGDAAVSELESLVADASAFAGRMPDLGGVDDAALAGLLAELSDLRHRARRLTSYIELRTAQDSIDGEAQDLSARVSQRMPAIEDALRSFQLAWLALPAERAADLAEGRRVAGDRHYLLSSRRFSPHTLSAPEERALSARTAAAEAAWIRLWTEESTALTVTCDLGQGEAEQTASDVLFAMWDCRPEVRRVAHGALQEAADRMAPTTARCLDAVVGDRLAIDELRGYELPSAATDLANEIATSSVDAMLDAIAARTQLWRRWVEVKGGLMGVERLAVEHRVAPLGSSVELSYGDTVARVAASFANLSGEAGAAVAALFSDGRVDAAPRKGKMGGAFCAELDGTCGPYLLLNHTGKQMDALVMAHELGHALHLSRCLERHSALVGMPSIALIEIPSTLAELLLVDMLTADQTDAGETLALAAGAIETSLGNIFECAVAAQVERGCYRLKAEGKTLTPDRITELCAEQYRLGLGDSVEGEEVFSRWSLMPHALMYRFYLYSYALSCLIALVLMRRRRDDPEGFAERYLAFLDAGGSLGPAELLAPLGIDLADRSLWDEGLDELERMIDAVIAGSPR